MANAWADNTILAVSLLVVAVLGGHLPFLFLFIWFIFSCTRHATPPPLLRTLVSFFALGLPLFTCVTNVVSFGFYTVYTHAFEDAWVVMRLLGVRDWRQDSRFASFSSLFTTTALCLYLWLLQGPPRALGRPRRPRLSRWAWCMLAVTAALATPSGAGALLEATGLLLGLALCFSFRVPLVLCHLVALTVATLLALSQCPLLAPLNTRDSVMGRLVGQPLLEEAPLPLLALRLLQVGGTALLAVLGASLAPGGGSAAESSSHLLSRDVSVMDDATPIPSSGLSTRRTHTPSGRTRTAAHATSALPRAAHRSLRALLIGLAAIYFLVCTSITSFLAVVLVGQQHRGAFAPLLFLVAIVGQYVCVSAGPSLSEQWASVFILHADKDSWCVWQLFLSHSVLAAHIVLQNVAPATAGPAEATPGPEEDADAALPEERVLQLRAWAQRVEDSRATRTIVDTFRQETGRSPTAEERVWVTADTPVAPPLLRDRAAVCASAGQQFLRWCYAALWLLHWPVTEAMLLWCGTWTCRTDALHAGLLLLLVAYFLFPSLLLRYRHGPGLAILITGSILLLYTHMAEVTGHVVQNLPGTNIPLDVLGLVPLESKNDLWPYAVAMAVLYAYDSVVVCDYTDWSHVLEVKELRAFTQTAAVQRWTLRVQAVLATVAITLTAQLSFRSAFVSVQLWLALVVLVAVTYQHPLLLRVCRRVCGTYSMLVLLLVLAAQWVRSQSLLVKLLATLPSCEAEPVLCGQEIGLLARPLQNWLLLHVAPWYIMARLVLSMNSAGATVILGHAHSKDMPFQRFWTFILHVCETRGATALSMVAHCSLALSWLVLFLSNQQYPCVLHVPYLLALWLDAAPLYVWPYALLHAAAVLVFQLRWVPSISASFPVNHGNGVVTLGRIIGLEKFDEGVSALEVALWPLLLATSLLVRRAFQASASVELLSATSMALLFASFEGVMLLLLCAMAVLQYSLAGLVLLACLGMLSLAGRPFFFQRAWFFCTLTAVVCLLLGGIELLRFCADFTIFPPTNSNQWLLWLSAPTAQLTRAGWLLFACLALLHATRRHATRILAASGALNIHSYNGYYSLIDQVAHVLRDRSDGLQSLSAAELQEAVPPIPIEVRERWYYACSKALTLTVCYGCPLALLTLLAGAELTASVMTSVYIVLGMVLVTYMESLHWHFYRAWRPLAVLYSVAPVCALLCHVPCVATFLRAHHSWAATLLGEDKTTHSYFPLEGAHVALLLAVVVQTRVYNDFVYEVVLYRLSGAAASRQTCYEERRQRLARESAAAVRAAEEYDVKMQARIAELQRAESPRVAAAPTKEASQGRAPSELSEASPTTTAPDTVLPSWLHAVHRLIRYLARQADNVNPDLASLTTWRVTLWRLGYMSALCASHHTSVLVVVGALFNSILTGCLFEISVLCYLLCVPIAYYPFAPKSSYQLLCVYIAAGIVLKTIICVVAVQHPPTEDVAYYLSRLIVSVPSNVETTATHRIALGASFAEFTLVVLHQYMCVYNGVYDNVVLRARRRREESEAQFASPTRTQEDEADEEVEEDELDAQDDLSGFLDVAGEVQRYVSWRCLCCPCLSVRTYVRNVLTVRGVGADRYLLYTVPDALAFVVLVVGYNSMTGNETTTIQETVLNNLLPGQFVLLVCLSVLLAVVERVLYIQRRMAAKAVLNVFLCLAYSVSYWYWWGTASSHVAGSLLFWLKMTAVYFSVDQVRVGFPRHRRNDPFTTVPNSPLRQYGYTVFRAVPFLWETRTLLDWTLQRTSLELREYLKVEDVYHSMYTRRVEICSEARWDPPRRLGTAVPVHNKWTTGVGNILLVFAALIGPLLYFSSLNPSTSPNEVTTLASSLSFTEGNAFFTSAARSTVAVPEAWPLWLARTRPSLVPYGLLVSAKRIQLLSLDACSSKVWRISPQALKDTLAQLQGAATNASTMYVRHTMTLQRTGSATSSSLDQSATFTWPIPSQRAADMLTMLTAEDTQTRRVVLDHYYSPFVFNRPSRVDLYSGAGRNLVTCRLELRREEDMLHQLVMYWCMQCDPLFSGGNVPSNSSDFPEYECLETGKGCENYNYEVNDPAIASGVTTSLYFAVLSDSIVVGIPFLNRLGLVALYTTFVLAIGRLLRVMLVDKAKNAIQNDVADPAAVEQLLEGIAIARECGELEVEHTAYLHLIDMLRSPEKLLCITGNMRDIYKGE